MWRGIQFAWRPWPAPLFEGAGATGRVQVDSHRRTSWRATAVTDFPATLPRTLGLGKGKRPIGSTAPTTAPGDPPMLAILLANKVNAELTYCYYRYKKFRHHEI